MKRRISIDFLIYYALYVTQKSALRYSSVKINLVSLINFLLIKFIIGDEKLACFVWNSPERRKLWIEPIEI